MKRLVVSFALAFALGVIVTVFVLQRPPRVAQEIAAAIDVPAAGPAASAAGDAPAAAPDDDGDGDGTAQAAADARPWPDDAGSAEQLLYAQRAMMDKAIAGLADRTPGRPNLYVIAFAGDGDEDVFRNEVEYVDRLFRERFDAAGHVLVLVNNPSTLLDRPIASLTNLQAAVDAVARKIDPAEDIVLLFLTSHGSSDHELLVSLDPLPLDQIEPTDLADLFSGTPVRNRVFVISACYSGGFIDALRGPTTMVITAARTDRTSFGCGTQSRITDFGRAFFANGLNDTDNLTDAFSEARRLVDAWETEAKATHSEPQIATTPQIEERLNAWRGAIRLGPAVPFPSPRQDDATTTAARR
jgi:hypothetical protein